MPINKKLNSDIYTFALSLFLCVPAINQIGVTLLPSLAGRLMTLLYLLCGIIVFFYVGLMGGKIHSVYGRCLLCVTLVVIWFVISKVALNYSEISLSKFVSMTFLAMLCPSLDFYDVKKLVKFIILLPTPGIFVIDRVFKISGFMYDTITMGVSYAFLPSVIATIVYLFTYWKDEKSNIIVSLGCLINLVYLFQMLQFGSRGPMLSVILCILFLFIFKSRNGNGIRVSSWKVVLIGLITVFLLLNLWSILGAVLDLFHKFGLHLNFVDKLFRLQSSINDISNGRDEIWITVIQEIFKSPIIGYGMSTSLHNIGIVYPHNVILQLLYDGGILLTVPILYCTVRGMIRWCRNCGTNNYILGTVLLFSSIPRAMLSTDVWEHGALWFTIMYFVLCGVKTIDRLQQ